VRAALAVLIVASGALAAHSGAPIPSGPDPAPATRDGAAALPDGAPRGESAALVGHGGPVKAVRVDASGARSPAVSIMR
jgi:hypothetical protein